MMKTTTAGNKIPAICIEFMVVLLRDSTIGPPIARPSLFFKGQSNLFLSFHLLYRCDSHIT